MPQLQTQLLRFLSGSLCAFAALTRLLLGCLRMAASASNTKVAHNYTTPHVGPLVKKQFVIMQYSRHCQCAVLTSLPLSCVFRR